MTNTETRKIAREKVVLERSGRGDRPLLLPDRCTLSQLPSNKIGVSVIQRMRFNLVATSSAQWLDVRTGTEAAINRQATCTGTFHDARRSAARFLDGATVPDEVKIEAKYLAYRMLSLLMVQHLLDNGIVGCSTLSISDRKSDNVFEEGLAKKKTNWLLCSSVCLYVWNF